MTVSQRNGRRGLKSTDAAPTFPDEDLPVGAVVQDEAVAGLQGALGERVLGGHQRDGHVPVGVGHLHRGKRRRGRWEKVVFTAW